jgi:hypothetical protein
MADTTAVFDSNVFDFAFDVVDIIPALLKVIVEREYSAIAAGQAAEAVIHLIDNMTTPGRSYPFTPVVAPTIEIYGPLDTSVLTATAMRQVGDGIFSYSFQTISGTHPVGHYSALFRCTNGDKNMVTKKHVIFIIK